MREIQASDGKARLARILDDVEHGETVIITRHGRPIARLVPEVDRRREETVKTMARIRALRPTMPKLSLEEILSARHDGHKY